MNRTVRSLAILAAAAAVLVLAAFWPHVRDEAFVIIGSRDASGGWYGTWSGFGGALPDVLIFSAMVGWYAHHACHVSRCWRPGRHKVGGTPYTTCRRHHPSVPEKVTAGNVADAHREAQ